MLRLPYFSYFTFEPEFLRVYGPILARLRLKVRDTVQGQELGLSY